MKEILDPLSPLVGLLGVVVGVVLNEYFYRKNRIEPYAGQIFMKRLQVYEDLYKKLNSALKVADDLIGDKTLGGKNRLSIWHGVALGICDFVDENKILLNGDIVVHTLLSIVGVADILEISNKRKCESEIEKFYQNIQQSAEMIRKETGLNKLDKHFKSITGSQPKSEYIEYFAELRKQRSRRSKK